MNPSRPAGFIGRDRELAALVELATGAAGGGTTMLLGGDAGVGKTRLVQQLQSKLAPRQVRLVVGHCLHTAEGSLPFVAVLEAVRSLCELADPDQLAELVGDRPELGLLLPELGDSHHEPAPSELGEGSQLRLFDAISGLLVTLAGKGRLCVVIEDLHWADRSTIDLFVFLVRALAGTPVTLVGTYRADEVSRQHVLRPVLADLDRNDLVEHLTLAPFDLEELTRFAISLLGDPPSARTLDDIAARSGGNAFFAGELVDALVSGRPGVRPELTDLILSRIESLDAPTQAVLRMAAVGGGAIREEMLEAVADTPHDTLVAALREAVEQQVIVIADDGSLRFRHALMREAVYGTLLPRERQDAHARYAAALVGSPDFATVATYDGMLAWHLRQARQFPRAIAASIDAARAAEAILAFSEALGHVETAIELWGDVDGAAELVGMHHDELALWAGGLADVAGRYPRAVQYYREVLADDSMLSEEARVLVHVRLGRSLQGAGQATDALAEYEQALAALPHGSVSAERAVALAGYGQQLMVMLRYPEAIVALEEAITLAEKSGDRRTEGSARNSLGSILLHSGRQEVGVAMLLDALAIAQQEGVSVDELRVYVNLTSGLNELGNLAAAEHHARTGLARSVELGHEGASGFFIAANLGETLNEMGRWDEVDAITEQARRPEGYLATTWMLTHSFDRALRRGDVEEARALLEEASPDRLAALEPQRLPAHRIRTAELAALDGDDAGARAALEASRETAIILSQELQLRGLLVQLDAVEARSGTGDDEALGRASALLAEMEELFAAAVPAGDETCFRVRAQLAEARAEVAHAGGHNAVPHWELAGQQWREGLFAWHAARADLRRAEVLLARGEREDAAEALASCREAASRLGAAPLERAAHELLEHAGLEKGQAESDAIAGPAGPLTARELDVLRLVSQGLTNRKIGETLFISPKTVSVHVTRILQKLGASNRTEAAAAARRAGLV